MTEALKIRRRWKAKKYAVRAGLYLAYALIAIFFLVPFFLMISMSLMSPNESIGNPQTVFLPAEPYWSNYARALDADFLRSLGNTLFIIGCNLILTPLGCSLCAFGFARCKFPGREVIFSITLATIMLPANVVQIPLYVMYFRWGWINTFCPFILPSVLGGGAANIFITRQFMRSIPRSLDEAATIDGANRFQIYLRIVMPMCVPVMLFVMIGVFNGYWNDFTAPLMYLRRKEVWTMPLAVYNRYAGRLSIENYPCYQMATGVFMILPPAILFFIFQRQIIGGVVMSDLKG